MTTVLVTRPRGQEAPLIAPLRAAGLRVIHIPTVAIAAGDREELARALRGRPSPGWLVITSANGAEVAARAVEAAGGLPLGTRVAAVGPATATALRGVGLPVDHVPAQFLTSEIADGLGRIAGVRVVLARADAATSALRDALRARGARVEEIVAYRTVEGPAASRLPLHDALEGSRRPDLLTFTSGSTVRGLVSLLEDAPDLLGRARQVPAACIGPVTAAEAVHLGFRTPVVASIHTASALADAIVRHLRNEVALA